MSYFSTYFSNSLAPSNCQKFFRAEGTETARSYFKITVGGEYNYSFLFANTIASTFDDGSESFANYVCKPWEISSLKASVCKEGFTPCEFSTVTFAESENKTVHAGEIFHTDPIRLSAKAGQRICLEITYRGEEIPYIHETLLHGEKLSKNGFEPCIYIPRPIMIGCDRTVKERIVFIGDSITEGIGTPPESYAGYAAVAAGIFGTDYAFWNIGLGYGRGADAATGGLWHYEAKQADTVFVCFGVNDILRGFTAHEIKKNLSTVVERLKKEGCRVCIQTVPPFDMTGEKREIWNEVNRFIKDELSQKTDFFFDNRHVLCDKAPNDHVAVFGGHPNEEGCRKWGEALARAVKL